MKCILTISILTLTGSFLFGQQLSTWTEIDTLEIFDNKTLVEYRTYTNSSITEQACAFFYPTVREIPKFRILQHLLTSEILVDSIVFHGERKIYLDNRKYEHQKFENGYLISTSYFDSAKQEISQAEFLQDHNMIGPCGQTTGQYFYHGKKKKK
jgi:hypothetical protein